MDPSIPFFAVDLPAPDLSPWRHGNTGIAGAWSFKADQPGPHVVLSALLHGNELAGAIVLAELLEAGLTPAHGRLTLIFVNLAAFDRFDPAQPTASRFVDEDLNRLWDPVVLDGPRTSQELVRARALRPLIDTADILLDLHSMLWPSDALILCGPSDKGRVLAGAIATPALVVSDHGHQTGPRLIDYVRFVDPDQPCAACLVEAGQHWQPGTVDVTRRCVDALLRHAGMLPDETASHDVRRAAGSDQRWAEVTLAVTANTAGFAFVQPFRGGEVIARRNTLIALDGAIEIRTPHDDCLLVMPSLRPSRGHTAVRLARFV